MAFTKRELSPRPEPKRAELDVSGPDSLRTTSNQLRVMLNPAGCDLGLSENGKLLGFAKGLLLAQGVLKWCILHCVEDGLVPEQGCKPRASALDDGNAIMGPNSSDISDCEVMMMVGLPASGKTTWAEKWAEEYPEKRFVLLGRNLILDEMKCHGVIPHRACASSVPRNNCGCSWSSGSISGGRAESCQNYGFVDPYGRSNTVGENSVVGAAATPKPYWINMAEPFKGGAARTSSFTCDNIGGSNTYFPVLPLLHMVCLVELLAFHYLHLLLHHQGPRIPIFLLACSSILEDITLLLRETTNFRIVLPSIPQGLGDLTSKLKTGKLRRPSSGSC
ncbi:hypothetical protein NC652_010396 [Populus alba x Populus x berolinensis]|nr:hypothetical protein NC652_010396 [Populus alba x Populus x berolinensis]